MSATGWMNNINGKNSKAKKLSCDRMDDDNIHGKNKKGEKKKCSSNRMDDIHNKKKLIFPVIRWMTSMRTTIKRNFFLFSCDRMDDI